MHAPAELDGNITKYGVCAPEGNWGTECGVPYGERPTTAVSDGPAARRLLIE